MSVPDSEKECPLCMEALDWDDLGFFPCSCGYQICRFCWHRLRTDENGLCPACRQAFPDIPVSFNPEISAEELKKQKKRNKERRSKDQVFKPQDLATLRVVQKNLVFVIGLPTRLTQEDLRKEFAHFGKIIKFVHNKSTAYITYSKPEEAIRAIRTLNASAAQDSVAVVTQQIQQFQQPTAQQLTNGTTTTLAQQQQPTTIPNGIVGLNNNVANLGLNNSFLNSISMPVPSNRLKASLGTTKYCNHFLRSQQCPKVGECMYLHEIAEPEASFTKEQMQAGKHVEYEKKLMDSYLVVHQPTSHSRHLSTHQPPLVLLSSQQLQPPPPLPPSQPPQPLQPQLFLDHQLHMHQPQSQQTLQDQLQKQIQIQLRQSPPSPSQQPLLQHQLEQQQQLQQPQLQQIHLQQQLELELQRRSPPEQPRPSQLTQQQQQQQQPQIQQQQQRQLSMLDSDSEDDGLDFDPISVSASGLRDLLDQQVQQAKQLQIQSYFQQINSSNQSLANVLFQQSNRLNHPTQTNGLIRDSAIDGLPQSLPSLASLTSPASQQQQVTWQNLSAWTNFLQRSGFGFENSR